MIGTTTLRVDDVTIAVLLVAVLIWILISFFVGRAAERKLRSFAAFFLISLFVSPILAAVIVAALPPSPEWLIKRGRRRACPECLEAIQLRATTCPHCQGSMRVPGRL